MTTIWWVALGTTLFTVIMFIVNWKVCLWLAPEDDDKEWEGQ